MILTLSALTLVCVAAAAGSTHLRNFSYQRSAVLGFTWSAIAGLCALTYVVVARIVSVLMQGIG